jgi:transcriptional regulator with GAF, ATPase, and Fis domain
MRNHTSAAAKGGHDGVVRSFVPNNDSRTTRHAGFERNTLPDPDHKGTSSNAKAQLEFPRLVADMAARFGAIDPTSIDDAIVDGLRQTGELLQMDWAVIWRRPAGHTTPSLVHHWIRPSCSDAPDLESTAALVMKLVNHETGEAISFDSVDIPEHERELFRRNGLRSGIAVPLAASGDDELKGLACGSSTSDQAWTAVNLERIRLVAGLLGQALASKARNAELQKALDEVERLRDRFTTETVDSRREVRVLRTPNPIVSESPAMRQVFAQLEQVAPTPATVLLLGETGSGKEVMAQAIHDLSPRRQKPMIRVNCAAIPTALIESELFGRERGAYTGALSRQIGRFEAAHQSTLLIDEIGDLSIEVQIKLLRVLQDRVIERLGSTTPIKVDVRIIAATNRSLEDAVRNKTFREDLFYRLNVFPVSVPPLREHVEDIPALVWNFVDEFSRSFGKPIHSIPQECMRQLQRYEWPGNVRELRNLVERAVIIATGPQLTVWPPRAEQHPMRQADMTLCALEGEHIRAVLEKTNWRVRGPFGAANRLGLKPTTLESRMARLGITRKRDR